MFLQVTVMACSVLVLKWVSPTAMGLFQSLLLIQSYSALVQAGTINGLGRELPFRLGAGQEADALGLVGTAHRVAIISAALLLLGMPLALWVFHDADTRVCAAAVLIGSSSAIYRNYLTVTYRAEQAFRLLARLMCVEAVLNVVTLPLVYASGLRGLAGRFVVLSVSGTLLSFLFRPIRNPGRFSWSDLRALLRTGAPLFVFGYLSGVAYTFPRVVLLSESGVRLVGIFAPVAAVIAALQMIPATIAQYVYPRMTFKIGRSGNPSDLWEMAKSTLIAVAVVTVPLAALLVYFVPLVLTEFFPAYAEAASAVRWAVIAGAFMAGSIAMNALNSLKSWRWMSVYTCSLLLFGYFGPKIGFRLGGTLESLAIGVAIGQALTVGVGVFSIRRATSRSQGPIS